MTYRRWPFACCCAAAPFIGWAWLCFAVDAPAADSPAGKTRAALQGAVEKNLEYGREWLEGKDFKSLARTGEGLIALAELLWRLSDSERWQTAAAELERSAQSLAAAAGKQDEALSKSLLAEVGRRNKALAELPLSGKPRPAKRPSIAMRSFMALLDGTHADAKAALTFGEIDEAKQTAHALSELGEALAAYRAEAKWADLSRQFSTAASKAAESSSRDAKEMRAALRGIYHQCEACHDARR